MPVLARFSNFCDVHDFWKAVETASIGISKSPMVNFEINSLSFYLFKNFCFPSNKFVPREVEFRFETETFFGCAVQK